VSGLVEKEIDYRTVDAPDKPLKKRIGNQLGVRQLCGFRKLRELPRKWDTAFREF
jgi:hypothetical protein